MIKLLSYIIIYFITFCLILFQPAYAQKFLGGAVAGINISQVDGDEVVGYKKAGFNGGALLKLHLDKDESWSTSMELLFSQRGAFRKALTTDMCDTCRDKGIDCDPKVKYNLRTWYVDIPLMFHYEHKKTSWAIGVGASYGRRVFLDEVKNGVKTEEYIPPFLKNDWNVIADVQFRIYRGLKANVRFQYSIVPFRKNVEYGVGNTTPWTRNFYHNYITFRLIYIINEKPSDSPKNKSRKETTVYYSTL